MSGRFDKYKDSGQSLSSHIANVNSFIDWLYREGLDIIEKEIGSLKTKINEGSDNKMFPKKINELINLGEDIEKIYTTYHFNRDN